MRNLRFTTLVAGASALAACAARHTYEPPPSGKPTYGHQGAIVAAFEEDCAEDPSCVCTLPPQKRPSLITVPARLRALDPSLPEAMHYECGD